MYSNVILKRYTINGGGFDQRRRLVSYDEKRPGCMRQQQKPEFEPQARHLQHCQTQLSNNVIDLNMIKPNTKILKKKEKRKKKRKKKSQHLTNNFFTVHIRVGRFYLNITH